MAEQRPNPLRDPGRNFTKGPGLLTSHNNPGSTCLALGLILKCKSGKTDVRAEGRRATYWQEREENGSGRGGKEKLLHYCSTGKSGPIEGREGGKALAFVMKIEDWVMIGLAEEGL